MKTAYFFIGLVLAGGTLMPVSLAGQGAAVSQQSLGGVWVLDRDKGDAGGGAPRGVEPGDRNGPDGNGQGRGGGRRGGGGGGGFGGFGGGGGRRGAGGGGFGGRQGADPERMQAVADYLRTSMTPSDRLTIVVKEGAVDIVEANGARLALQTDNKKIDERAGNGLVKLTRKSHWDGNELVTEMDIDNGPKIERKYTVSSTGSELQISTTFSGGFGGRGAGRGGRPVVQVYDRFEPSRQ
jgi:hypothetical protein